MSTKTELLRELATVRDEAQVRAHLLSLEAKQRWDEVETALLQLEHKLDQSADRVAESALDSAKRLFESARHLMVSQEGLRAPARQLMTHPVLTCHIRDDVNQVAQLFWDASCGAVPVVDDDGKLQGMLTDRDICMAAYTQGRRLPDIGVESAMSRRVHSVKPEETLEQLLAVMAEAGVRHLPVVDASERVVGIVSLGDVARYLQRGPAGAEGASKVLIDALVALAGGTFERHASGVG